MDTNIVDSIRVISMFSVLIPMSVYLFKMKALPRENHIIGLVVAISAITELIVAIQVEHKQSTAIASNIYFLLIFIALCFYYNEVVFKFKSRKYFYTGLIVYAGAFLLIGVQLGVSTFQGEVWAIEGLVLVVFGIIYNNYQVEKPPLLDRNLYSGLIFNAAIMFYFSFNFFLFIIADYVFVELSPDKSRMTWSFHNVNNIAKNIAFAFGLYYTNRRRLNLSDEEIEKIQWRHLQ